MGLKGLNGKTAIVTGAASGIGAATARRLLDEGCNVVGVDLKEEAVLQACAGADAARLAAVAADVSTEHGCELYLQRAVEAFGGVQLFVNNAGILGRVAPIVDLPVDDFDQVMRVNLRSIFLGLQTVLRQMVAQGQGGSIVNVSSKGALKPPAGTAGYATSKGGIITLTKIAAQEHGRDGVRVNVVCPGTTETPILPDAYIEGQAELCAGYPMPRFGKPEEIASLIVYLLSDEASFQTGGVYSADGGSLLV